MTRVYYNEIDPYCVRWLHNLILEGVIASGDVDDRSIEDVTPADLKGYSQCHFFAGIGVWSYTLRLAGWSDDRPIWTGSCPCQPFSAAGKRGGAADERHLWPAWYHLIEICRPGVVFGEQVASKDGLGWLDLVSTDLENAGYAVGAFDLCAAGVGAPHIRQRLYFVADGNSRREHAGRCSGSGELANTDSKRRIGESILLWPEETGRHSDDFLETSRSGEAGIVGSSNGSRSGRHSRAVSGAQESAEGSVRRIANRTESAGIVGNTNDTGLEGRRMSAGECAGQRTAWTPSDLIWCRDDKWRPVEPGTFPLAHGVAARVGRLRAYGNAIVAPLAAEFVKAYMDCRPT